MLDDDLLMRHGDGAFRKRHRRNHGQELRCQADCQRNRKQQRLKRIAVACDADDNQKENEKENRSRQELAEISQAFIEGSLFRSCREASRNIAKGGSGARRDDLGGCRSANDGCAQKDHVARIRFGRGGLSGRFLFGGERFARQRCLLDIEITGNQEARVCGNQISGGKPDDVSRHHLTPPNFLPLPAAQDGCRRGNPIAQLFDGPLRTIGLA